MKKLISIVALGLALGVGAAATDHCNADGEKTQETTKKQTEKKQDADDRSQQTNLENLIIKLTSKKANEREDAMQNLIEHGKLLRLKATETYQFEHENTIPPLSEGITENEHGSHHIIFPKFKQGIREYEQFFKLLDYASRIGSPEVRYRARQIRHEIDRRRLDVFTKELNPDYHSFAYHTHQILVNRPKIWIKGKDTEYDSDIGIDKIIITDETTKSQLRLKTVQPVFPGERMAYWIDYTVNRQTRKGKEKLHIYIFGEWQVPKLVKIRYQRNQKQSGIDYHIDKYMGTCMIYAYGMVNDNFKGRVLRKYMIAEEESLPGNILRINNTLLGIFDHVLKKAKKSTLIK